MLLTLAGLNAQNFPFRLPEGAGTFRLGVVAGDESCWLDECKVQMKGKSVYILQGKLLGEGKMRLAIYPLTDSDGFIMEVSGSRLPQDLALCWAYGGCNKTLALSGQTAAILPEACRDNVFSDEVNAFTVYYGESMALRVTQGIAPVGSEMRLADAHRQTTPLDLYHSGKKTDAPVIAALYPWQNKENCYFCIYKQNAKADYNYFMLADLFERESRK